MENTKIMAELTLYFDDEYDVYSLSNIIGIECNDCKKKAKLLLTPLQNNIMNPIGQSLQDILKH